MRLQRVDLLPWAQEARGSNPRAPTKFFKYVAERFSPRHRNISRSQSQNSRRNWNAIMRGVLSDLGALVC